MITPTRSSRISERWRSVAIVLLLSVLMAGCQSLVQSPAQGDRATTGKPLSGADATPEYRRHLAEIDRLLPPAVSGGSSAHANRPESLRTVGETFSDLINAGPATNAEFQFWGTYFNRLGDTVELVVNGELGPAEAEPLYELAADLYQRFLQRSNLPERPYVAVDGEASAFFAGNYFLCTMPEVLADRYGRRGDGDMAQHLEQAMERYLSGPCEPDLMFSAAEMLYDYALVAGPRQAAFRERIEEAGPGKSVPWLLLLDNLEQTPSREQALARLDRAMAEARAVLDAGDEVSVEFESELKRQRQLLERGKVPLEALRYRP